MPPLAGIKILDFTQLLPGPFGTMILADLGADIIRVDNPANPDLVRFLSPVKDGISAAYGQLNRGKRSLGIDLKKKEAKEIIYALVKQYDIVTEQFRPGVMDRLGIGYDDLKKVNPAVIYCSLTGYGQTGSYAKRAGHDINYMALSGVDSFSGQRDTGPVLSGIQIADVAGGSKNLAIAVLAAVIKRMNTGEGDRVDISITDSVLAMASLFASGFLAGGPEPGRETEFINGATLYDYYETSDGRHLSVGPLEPKFFTDLCKGLVCPELVEEGVNSAASISREVKEKIASVIKSKPLSHWVEKFRNLDGCVEPVLTLSEALSRPPLSEQGMVVEVKSPGGIPVKQVGNPLKFDSGDCCAETAGVPPGFHSEEILGNAGYSPEAIDALVQSGVIKGKDI